MKATLEFIKEHTDDRGNVDLRGTGITSLPDGLCVGGWLYLRGTGITSLPEGLCVGGWLDLSGTGITDEHKEGQKVRKPAQGEYVKGRYLYADGILTHVKRARKFGEYTYYIGKIKGKNVVSDGTHYAHCSTFKEGVEDIAFKRAKERGSEQYKSLSLDSIVKKEDAITMYRIITGACRQGTQNFLDGLAEIKNEYTVAEIVELTRGHYGASVFADFFRR
jgi:hypothetical protein